jgi:hypothetical protein
MTDTTTTEAVAPVANLAAARKLLALTKKAAAAKPAAKKAAPRKAPVSKGPKLRWSKDDKTGRLTATSGDVQYVVEAKGEKWQAVILSSGKRTTLLEGVGAGRAYTECLKHNRGE